jgi:hypothetical protein
MANIALPLGIRTVPGRSYQLLSSHIYNCQQAQKTLLSGLRVLCCRGKNVSRELFPSNSCCSIACNLAAVYMSQYKLQKNGSALWCSSFKRSPFTTALVTQFYPIGCISFSILLSWIWYRANTVGTKTWWTGDPLGRFSLLGICLDRVSQQRACRRAAVPGE